MAKVEKIIWVSLQSYQHYICSTNSFKNNCNIVHQSKIMF